MASRNQKATLMAGAMFVIGGAIALCAALVKPETRIIGTIDGRRVDIPVWLQNEPEYAKIKNAKVENGWGWARLVLGAIALVPTGMGVALVAERRAELPEEAQKYAQDQKEKQQLAQVKTNYKVGLAATMLKKTGEAKVVIHEEELEMKVDAYREVNGIYAPEPVKQIEPPLLREKEATGNPFEGMKTPEEYAQELKAAREGAIARLPADGNAGTVPVADQVVDDRKKFYQDRGNEIMDSMVDLKMSILSVAPTGGGKTHTLDKWLKEIQELYPACELYVIAQKNDPFMGLSIKGRVTRFSSDRPEPSLHFLDVVHKELQRRKDEPLHQRKHDDIPVRLILDDWYASYLALQNYTGEFWRDVKRKLSDIVTLGREVNVCLYVCTQSYILSALGLAEDSNIRNNLAIVCQGLVKVKKHGRKQGTYQSLQQIIRNTYITPSKEDRQRLADEIQEVIELSKKHGVPAVFSAIDESTLALMPYVEITLDGLTNQPIIDSKDGEKNLADDAFQVGNLDTERDRLEKLLNLDSAGHSDDSDTNDSRDLSEKQNAHNDDSTSVSADYQNNQLNQDNQSSQEYLPDYEEADLEYLKWLPKESKLIEILEQAAPDFSLSNIVRSRLKVTSSQNAKRAKRAIMALVKKLNRADLWAKFGMDDINI